MAALCLLARNMAWHELVVARGLVGEARGRALSTARHARLAPVRDGMRIDCRSRRWRRSQPRHQRPEGVVADWSSRRSRRQTLPRVEAVAGCCRRRRRTHRPASRPAATRGAAGRCARTHLKPGRRRALPQWTRSPRPRGGAHLDADHCLAVAALSPVDRRAEQDRDIQIQQRLAGGGRRARCRARGSSPGGSACDRRHSRGDEGAATRSAERADLKTLRKCTMSARATIMPPNSVNSGSGAACSLGNQSPELARIERDRLQHAPAQLSPRARRGSSRDRTARGQGARWCVLSRYSIAVGARAR